MEFCHFIKECTFPQIVCVTEGHFFSKNVQIFRGDVLILRSFSEHVTLRFHNKNDISTYSSLKIKVTSEYSVKFKVLLPTDSDTDGSMIIYPTIADLLLDCPTHFEATTSYDDPYLPGMSVRTGDRFWFERIIKDSKNGQDRLKARDSKNNIVILSQGCRGNFRPLKDDNEYMIKELIDMAPVQRRLLIAENDVTLDEVYSNCQDLELSRNEDIILPQPYCHNSNLTSLECNVECELQHVALYRIVYMYKPEVTVIVSPFQDLETTWEIPANVSLKVRVYSQNDYEVPVTKPQQSQFHTLNTFVYEAFPNFTAPGAPSLQQLQISMDLYNFVDIYCTDLPVIAKVVNIAETHPFFQEKLSNVAEIIIYRLDEVKRLYIKDTKSDIVFGLSKDVRVSFVEYPRKFTLASELVCLPAGSEVIVLEDIAADFPKPLSLNFGDVVRVTSNIPCVIKTKLGNRDCQVIKCEKIDPGGGGSTRIKLPLDFEVNMLLKTDQSHSRLISVEDLIDGTVPIPSQNVTCVAEDATNTTLKELPTDSQILATLTEACIVATSFSTLFTDNSTASVDNCNDTELSATLPSLGIPLTSQLVLAFKERLPHSELHRGASEVEFTTQPIDKMTISQFEERQRQLKKYSQDDLEQLSSSSTTDDSETKSNTSTRDISDGILGKKPKSARMDTVRRFSQALNPKHWRQTKPRPPPLPHPFYMESAYFNKNLQDGSGSISFTGESTKRLSPYLQLSTEGESYEDENLYEELEIQTCKPVVSTVPPCQGLEYSPHPPVNTPPKPSSKCLEKQHIAVKSDSTSPNDWTDVTDYSTSKLNDSFGLCSKRHNDIIRSVIRVKKWASDLGNSMGNRFSIRFKEDITNRCNTNDDGDSVDFNVTTVEHITVPDTCRDDNHLHSDLSLTLSNSHSEDLEFTDKIHCESESVLPLPQLGDDSSVSVKGSIKIQDLSSENENTLVANESNLSISPKPPKPKPRNLNKSVITNVCSSGVSRFAQLSVSARNVTDEMTVISSSDNTDISLVVEKHCRQKPLPKPRSSTRKTV